MQCILKVVRTRKFFQTAPVFRTSLLRRIMRRSLINLRAHGIQIQFAVARTNILAPLDLNQPAVLFFRLHNLLLNS